MTDLDQPQTKPLNEARRCTEAMARIHEIFIEEFPDLRPPAVIFVLNWLAHRIFIDIDEIVGEGPRARQPEPDPVFKN